MPAAARTRSQMAPSRPSNGPFREGHTVRRARHQARCTMAPEGRGCAWHPSTSAPAARPATPEPRGPHEMTALTTPSAPADLREDRNPLDAIFHPTSIAVIGATEKEGSVGRTILWNLLSSPFGGTVYPVNPTRPAILGVKAYPTVGAIGESIDLAVIVTPARTAPGLIDECGTAGVRAV